MKDTETPQPEDVLRPDLQDEDSELTIFEFVACNEQSPKDQAVYRQMLQLITGLPEREFIRR